MIILTLNRCAGYSFIRILERQGLPIPPCCGVEGENRVVLELDSSELNLFRRLLITRPDNFENAEGILRMLGQA